ncbi:hypothetical protein JCM3766R1_002729 [Sporobolomyces carnicolor]
MNTNTNTNTATDKSQLLAALAQQLRTEKEQGELAAREMVQLEHIVEEKHASFLAEQDVLISRRDANEAEIATLRSRLTRLRRQLDEANHLRDDEANAFLQLLE